MNILVINAGSSSFKYQLINMINKHVLVSGIVERIGEDKGKMTYKAHPNTDHEKKYIVEQTFSTHVQGMKAVIAQITNIETGVIKSIHDIHAVGHRVVMGGEVIKKPVIVTQEIKKIILDYTALSPLHNPANLAGIEVSEELFPNIPNVAVFDTEFHQTLPEAAYMYPLPYNLYEKYKIRRYGFHGTSHRYVTCQAALLLGKPLEAVNLITCHLGNGCSMAAIQQGKSIDTTMGTTPLEGLMMGTRCGDIDPAIIPFIMEKTKMSAQEIDILMNKNSGLKGICNMNDMRDIHKACSEGNPKAQLALTMFTYRIKKYIGAYFAILDKLDGLVFTAGIGENDDVVRSMICSDLEHLGIEFDKQQNALHEPKTRTISKKNSPIPIFIIPTNEELEIAQCTLDLVKK